MIIYHGSSKIIEQPEYGEGKPYNDYGRGFYCTENRNMALEWGVEQECNGFANCYELNMQNLKVLNLNEENFCTLNWLAVLLENRYFDTKFPIAAEAKEYILDRFQVDYKTKDIIIGYRADDSYFSFAQDFLNNAISLRQLNQAMQLGNLGEQIVLKSKKAFCAITFRGFEIADSCIWYPKKKERDDEARRKYFDETRNKRRKGDLFISQIIDEEMTVDELRLQ